MVEDMLMLLGAIEVYSTVDQTTIAITFMKQMSTSFSKRYCIFKA